MSPAIGVSVPFEWGDWFLVPAAGAFWNRVADEVRTTGELRVGWRGMALEVGYGHDVLHRERFVVETSISFFIEDFGSGSWQSPGGTSGSLPSNPGYEGLMRYLRDWYQQEYRWRMDQFMSPGRR